MRVFILTISLGLFVAAMLLSGSINPIEHKIGYSIVGALFLIAAAIASRP